MKYEIEAAVEFLTSLLFPPNIHSISHSQSTPTLTTPQPTSPRSNLFISPTFPISNQNLNLNSNFENENEKLAKSFSKILSKNLAKKFASHWYEEEPIKGQAYRSILVDCENNFVDKVILESARKMKLKNIEIHLKNVCKNGFQMWIDPGEVEVEFFSPSSSHSSSSSSSSHSSHSLSSSNLYSTSPYKSSTKISNQVIYSIRKNTSASQRISRPPSPPFHSSSPSLPSSSPPSSPAPSSSSPSYSSSNSISSHSPIDIKMPFFTRQNKPIRISVRQNDEKMEEIDVKDFNNSFNHSINEFNDHHSHNLNNNINNSNNSSVKSTFAIPQTAM